MSRRHISQREAHAAVKERDALRGEREVLYKRWGSGRFPGVHIDTVDVKNAEWHIAITARKLGHAVVIVPGEDQAQFNVYAVSP